MSRLIKAAFSPWGQRHHSSQGIQQSQTPALNVVLEVPLSLQENAFSSHDQGWGFRMPPPSKRFYCWWFCLSYEDIEGMPNHCSLFLSPLTIYLVSENICSRIGLEWPKVWEMWHGGIVGSKTWCSCKAVRKISGVFLPICIPFQNILPILVLRETFPEKVVKTYPDLLIDLISQHFLTAFSSENFLPNYRSSKPHQGSIYTALRLLKIVIHL